MSEHKIEACFLPKPKTRNIGWVAACLKCHKLYVLRWKLTNPMSPYALRIGGDYHWEAIEREK